jgi:hypothetical protein
MVQGNSIAQSRGTFPMIACYQNKRLLSWYIRRLYWDDAIPVTFLILEWRINPSPFRLASSNPLEFF